MPHELITTWLSLPPGPWPPDHYTLLGLMPGEADVERIEQKTHERMTRIRHYQLNHPEIATDAMNRLAQAFSCLTDPKAKEAYDRLLFSLADVGAEPEEAPALPFSPPLCEPVSSQEPADPLAWLFGPWSQLSVKDEASGVLAPNPKSADWSMTPPPQRIAVDAGIPLVPLERSNGQTASTPIPETKSVEAITQSPEPFDPVAELGRSSPFARRGLGTKRALYYRVARTRRLLFVWDQVGKYLNRPNRKLVKSIEAANLSRQLAKIPELLQNFPPLMGQAGQPAYMVVSLARQPMIAETFRTLLPSQREALARDWRSGHTLLISHRDFLRQELRSLRKKNWASQVLRMIRSSLSDHPGISLFALGLIIFFIALVKYFR